MPEQNIVRVSGKARLPWTCGPDADSGVWVGVCPPLALTIQGETWADLMESIADALDALIKDLFEDGELEQFLKEHGWTLSKQIQQDALADSWFDVPFVPEQASANDLQRAVSQQAA